MRAVGQETAPQTALRNCSKEMQSGSGRGGHYRSDFGEGGLPVIKHVFVQKFSQEPSRGFAEGFTKT